jgi:flagellar basal-body rod protein FlgB
MEEETVGLFDMTQAMLEQALSGSALRNEAIANNIANVNTAGFKRSDVDFTDALKSALDSGESESQIRSIALAPKTDTTSAARADGNNVDIDTEMANLNENFVTYQALTSVAKARLHMIEIAIGGR